MARGGRRPGAGRPLGSRNKPRRVSPKLANSADAALRQRVAECVAAGMDASDIAIALDVTEIELRARCERELTSGKTIIRAQLLAGLSEAAAKGNAGAAKVLLALMGDTGPDKADQAEKPDDFTERALRLYEGGKK